MAKIPESLMIQNLVEMSFSVAIQLEQSTITTEHLLYAIMNGSATLRNHFNTKGIAILDMNKELLEHIQANSTFLRHKIPNADPNIMTGQLTSELSDLLVASNNSAAAENRDLDIVDVLLALFNLRESYSSYFMTKYGITDEMILEVRTMITQKSGKGGTGVSESALSTFCKNLNEAAKNTNQDPLIGRSKEIFAIAHTLSKRKKCNVILIGDPGVGKTMIVEGLAAKINAGDVPEPLKGKQIYSLEVGTLLAGAKYRGDFEEKVKAILEELSEKTDAILFVDEAHLMDAGEGKGKMGLGLSSMLKPYLSRGVLKMIASTTWEGYRQTFEKDSALMRRFRPTFVDEPSRDETIAIIRGTRELTEKFHNVTIEDDAIIAAVDLTIRHQEDKKLPDKALDILDSACARKHVVDDGRVITRETMIREIEDLTGRKLREEKDDSAAAKKALTFTERLNNIVFHQEKAIATVGESIVIAQAGLRNQLKPIAQFLFVGPSGVGKTMTARQIAKELDMDFIKYDMSEFQEKHAATRLIGAPPGYIGFGDSGVGEGQLVNDIIRKPNSVILLDEAEKAHPDVFNIFLQLFDEGTVTGTTGKVADARGCIFIMSSNLGTREAAKGSLGFVKEKSGKSESAKAVEQFFLTEFRGRWTAEVHFESLDEISYRRIVVERVNDIMTMLPKRNLRIIPTEALISKILSLNNSKEYGAREIEKIVRNTIYYQLGVKLLNNMIPDGSTISLDWNDEKLVITPSTSKVLMEQPIEKE